MSAHLECHGDDEQKMAMNRRYVLEHGLSVPWQRLSERATRRALPWLLLATSAACSGVTAQMESKYSQETRCYDDVEVVEMPSRLAERYQVRGCGKRTHFYCVEGKCRSPEFEARRRHAKEHGCLPQDVGTYDLDDDRFVTDGCGHKATYACKTDPRTTVRCSVE